MVVLPLLLYTTVYHTFVWLSSTNHLIDQLIGTSPKPRSFALILLNM